MIYFLQVIGDKKGGGTTMELTEKPHMFSILKELNETVGIPLKFIHVIRNPFAVISTWVLRLYDVRLTVNDGKTKVPIQCTHCKLSKKEALCNREVSRHSKALLKVFYILLKCL